MRSLRAASCGIGVNALAATSVVYIGSLYLENALGHSAIAHPGVHRFREPDVAVMVSGNAMAHLYVEIDRR